jgi:alpha-mannosidase
VTVTDCQQNIFFGVRRVFTAFCFPRRHPSYKLLAILFLTPLFASLTRAQENERAIANAIKTLPTPSQEVIQRLYKLNQLPPGDWRFHVGDMDHGEATSLDDSSWAIARPQTEGPTEAVWYRRLVEVPKTLDGYDLTGSRIWFHFEANANGPIPQIIYFNGRRVAMGDDLEPIVLFDSAKPGDKVLVAVKLLQTVDQKHFAGAEMRIDFSSTRPNPEDLCLEFVSANLLVPSLSSDPSQQTATLESAIGAVDLKALDAADQEKFDASLRKAQSGLEPLKPTLQEATLHLTGNSHIDAAWLWPWTETVDAVKRTFGTALQLMYEYPQYTYTQSAAQYNVWMADKYPELNEQIKQRIQQGRWEIVGGMWIEPDLNMPDGESLVRQLLIGKRTYKDLYGVDVRIGWNPDSFGYNWQLPQIYKRSGVNYFVTQKMAWNDTNQLPFKLFWWESPDGSKVLTYFPHDYANNNLNPVRLSTDLATARKQAPGMLQMMDLYGVGDHGGGPTRAMLDEGLHWSEPNKVFPQMHFGIAQSYFSDIEGKIDPESKEWNYDSIAKGYQYPPAPAGGKVSIPTWKDELYFEYHRGVFTTQADHKRSMRESEEWLLNAEKYSALAWVNGLAYPGAELNEAWKKVLFNQFHDLAAGSGIGIIYKDAQKDYQDVRWATDEASGKALHAIQARINTRGSEVPVLVFNPLAWQRSGLTTVDVEMPSDTPNGVSVLDAHNHVLPSEVLGSNDKTNSYHLRVEAKDVPSLGYSLLHVIPGQRPFVTDLKASGTTIENAALKVTVDPQTGCITSLYDKKAQFETLAQGACGNELIAFKDTPKEYDAWNIDADFEQVSTKLDKADSVELVEKGPLKAVIRVTRTWQSSKFVQDITLYDGVDRVDVVNDIDWHETHILLKAAFPLAASSNKATYEIPYGSIERPTTRNNSWEDAKFEVPALRWADLGDGQHGFSLINESKYGYDAKGNVLRLSLLRSPTWPDPNADREHHHFTYALYPHAGDWKQALTVRQGYDFNYQLKAMQVEAHSGTLPAEHAFVTVQQENVVLTAMKKTEDGMGLILRFYEWAGKSGDVEVHVPQGATTATVTNLMEQPQGSPLTISGGDRVTAPIHPYEILTLRVDYPHPQ